MGNNIKELRLAFLLTPKELAARMGTYPQQVRRLEDAGRKLSDEWIEAVAEAFGVPKAAVTDPSADIPAIVAAAHPAAPHFRTCPIAARFAIQAMAARLGGMKLALELSEDDLATAVRNLVAYVDAAPEEEPDEARAIRLSQALQIVVLAILQSHGVWLDPHQLQAISFADRGASSLIRWFSEIDETDF